MPPLLEQKTVLVIGGTGSIGSEIVAQALLQKPRAVRILSRDEHKQHLLKQRYADVKSLRFLIGDVRDAARVARAMEGVDVVFHAAAMKHVPACEFDAFEAVKTNVLGTQNVIQAALDAEAERTIFISTDKACEPVNVMGATKLLGERLVTTGNYIRGPRKTRFASFRFGNVLNSRGSVIPTVVDQVRRGQPVKVTDPEMTRFVMSIQRAVQGLYRAVERMLGGEVFVLKMPALTVGDLVGAVVEMAASKLGKNPAAVEVRTVGHRIGERMHELLLNETECRGALEDDEMYIIPPHPELWGTLPDPYAATTLRKVTAQVVSSETARQLSREEFKKALVSEGIADQLGIDF
jgi:FlaA1/EpsC-like NDP-sugar epimerase